MLDSFYLTSLWKGGGDSMNDTAQYGNWMPRLNYRIMASISEDILSSTKTQL